MVVADDPFEPDAVQWHPVSLRLATGRRIIMGLGCASLVVPVLVLVVVLSRPLLLIWLLLVAAAAGWMWWLLGRQVQAMGYAEQEDDLLIRQGILFRSIVVVPYGRMQFVDVQAGPLARRLGYSTVQLHTASAGSDAVIDGVALAEAARLRDQLASRGQARLAGL